MQEVRFVKQNASSWQEIEQLLQSSGKSNPDALSNAYIKLVDDLAFSRTFYPNSKTTHYLNSVATKLHQKIYINKAEERSRIITFWKEELPLLMFKNRKAMLISFTIFVISVTIGALSAANDSDYVRLILGDRYVNMTLENIEKNDPMAVYKSMNEMEMFFAITLNNIRVSFMAFISGILASFGTGFLLLYNGVMLGSFQYFFYQQGLLIDSMLVIWIHGTLEIAAIILAGGAGLVMGNSILFPGTYSRMLSFRRGAQEGLKIVIGLVPIFIVAGFLEGFVTRHTGMPIWGSLSIIIGSLGFLLFYFIIYPYQKSRNTH